MAVTIIAPDPVVYRHSHWLPSRGPAGRVYGGAGHDSALLRADGCTGALLQALWAVPCNKAFVEGITAAAIEALSKAMVVLAFRSLVDMPTLVLAALTALALWEVPKLKRTSVYSTRRWARRSARDLGYVIQLPSISFLQMCISFVRLLERGCCRTRSSSAAEMRKRPYARQEAVPR